MFSIESASGTINWQTSLDNKTGYSKLMFLNDSNLIIFNSALCNLNGSIRKFGIPYFSIINSENGGILKTASFPESSFIADYKVNIDSSLLILLNNKIIILDSLSKHNEIPFETSDSIGDFQAFYDNINIELCILDTIKNKWINIKETVTKQDLLIITNKGITVINKKMELINFISMERIGILKFEDENNIIFETSNSYKDYYYSDGFIKFSKKNNDTYKFTINNPFLINNDKLYILNRQNIELYEIK